MWRTSDISFAVFLFNPGFTQFIYVLPATLVLVIRKRSDVLKVLWGIAGVCFLLNSACFGLIAL